METRELYKQKYEAQLHEWSARLEALGAHADKLTAEAKLEAKPRIDALHARLEDGKVKLNEIAVATEDKWDDVKKSADHTWNEIKGAIEGAYDALKPEKKGELTMGWLGYWFGVGLGAGAARTVFGEDRPEGSKTARWPVRQQTEEEILADEKRYAEDEKRLDAADAAAKHRR